MNFGEECIELIATVLSSLHGGREDNMTVSTCIVIDSACDLPADFIRQNGIEILPIGIRYEGQFFSDDRNEAKTVALYRDNFDKRGIDAESVPYDVEQITKLLASRVAPKYDNALIITITATRSPIFDNARKAVFLNLQRFKQARRDAGLEEFFSIRVLDSETLFTGQAILVHEAVRLVREEGLSLNKLTSPLEALRGRIYAYLIPRDLYFVHKRGKKKGENSISWMSYKIGSMMDVKPIIQAHRGETEAIMKASGFDAALKKLLEHAMRQIKQGLATPVIAISYAGDLRDMESNPLVNQFIDYTKKNGIKVLLSVMSTTAAINVGTGSFSLAFAAG